MGRCLFPDCNHRTNLISIPKKRKQWKQHRGQYRENYIEKNSIINEMNEAWCHIIKGHVSDFKYKEGNRNMVICPRHFHDSVLTKKKNGNFEPILGALPTLNFYAGHVETRNARCSIVPLSQRIDLEVRMKRPVATPVSVPPKMERNIKRYFQTQDLNEQKRIEFLNKDKIFYNTSYMLKLFESALFKDWNLQYSNNSTLYILVQSLPSNPSKFITVSIALDVPLEITEIKVDIPSCSYHGADDTSNYMIRYEHFKHSNITKYSEIREIMIQLSNHLDSLVFDSSFFTREIVIQGEFFLLTFSMLNLYRTQYVSET